jgi:dephospho-CoA kinase
MPTKWLTSREILDSAGEIDRSKLGAIVFNHPDRLTQLAGIVHPHVTSEILLRLERIEQAGPAVHTIVDGSVMVESGFHRDFQFLIVVYCTPEQQLERLIKRNALAEPDARKRIALQLPLEEKVRLADFVVDNSSSLENTRFQVDVLLDRLGWVPLSSGTRKS